MNITSYIAFSIICGFTYCGSSWNLLPVDTAALLYDVAAFQNILSGDKLFQQKQQKFRTHIILIKNNKTIYHSNFRQPLKHVGIWTV